MLVELWLHIFKEIGSLYFHQFGLALDALWQLFEVGIQILMRRGLSIIVVFASLIGFLSVGREPRGLIQLGLLARNFRVTDWGHAVIVANDVRPRGIAFLLIQVFTRHIRILEIQFDLV